MGAEHHVAAARHGVRTRIHHAAWTTLLAALFLRERLTPSRIGAVVCGLVGVAIILRPGLGAFKPAALLVLAAAFGYASSNIATKKLTAFQTTFTIVLWMNLMQLPLAYAGSDPAFFLKIDSGDLLAVLAVGIAGLTAHFCLTNALAAGEARSSYRSISCGCRLLRLSAGRFIPSRWIFLSCSVLRRSSPVCCGT